MIYFCAQKNRRAAVLQSPALNGIDYLEVVGPPGQGTQLAVTFLKDARALALTGANFALSGDTALTVTSVVAPTAADPLVLLVNLSATGDFSSYTLAIVAQPQVIDPPDGLDPALASVTFSFKAGCPSPADCRPTECCPSPVRQPPDINYLAKDYEGFRQVMMDRLAALVPAWTETHAADLGVAMVEVLAYAADHLSYQQDAVSTEAYLGTARSRISARRHARLVDYTVGEGRNARTWVYVETLVDNVVIPSGTAFYARTPGFPTVVLTTDPRKETLKQSPQPIFETLQDATLHLEQNAIQLHTWSDANCCLPAGATQATLVGTLGSLTAGSVLVFEEILGPVTGNPEDADPSHRCAVRLKGVRTVDYKGRPLVDPLTNQAITSVTWSSDDALPFPLCVSSTSSAGTPLPSVSVARGNIIPADHGSWAEPELLPPVPALPVAPVASAGCTCNTSAPTVPVRSRYYPQLAQAPLTFAVPYAPQASASAFLATGASGAVPTIAVTADDGVTWNPTEDLLGSNGATPAFTPEIENDGSAFLRFGDGVYGAAPDTGQSFTALYRVGNGSRGNIGRDSLAHVILAANTVRSVRNPLPATGGTDAETTDHIRRWAPFAFQTQERCVTELDYGAMATAAGVIEQARGTLRWTGSWHTAFVSVEPVGPLAAELVRETTSRLSLLRMMGTDLEVEGAVLVGLRIQLQICVSPDHFAGDVYDALMQIFVAGDQCTGQRGLLDPASFSFGATVYASPLLAAAQAVDGVVSASLSVFTRMDDPSVDGVAQGYITLGRLQIPRCDNDPNHLDRGVFQLQMEGGK